jgi:DNA-binding beta-propeller fold protein YncE
MYTAPAGIRQAMRRNGPSILPGGRIVAPLGQWLPAGPSPTDFAASPSGQTIAVSGAGPEGNFLTILHQNHQGDWEREPDDMDRQDAKAVFRCVTFRDEHTLFVAEENSGRIREIDWNSGQRRVIDLSAQKDDDPEITSLIYDRERGILFAADPAHARVIGIGVKTRKVLSSIAVDNLPLGLGLSPDHHTLYVHHPLASVEVLDVSDPAAPKIQAKIALGAAAGPENECSRKLAGMAVTADRLFVSNPANDSIVIIDARSNAVEGEIPIRVPGLEKLRGVLPAGLAYDPGSGWLLVAEAGINAVGVLDTREKRVVGHLPAGWFPTRIVIGNGKAMVLNTRGQGSGPSVSGAGSFSFSRGGPEGTVSLFSLPDAAEIAAHTDFVLRANGFIPIDQPEQPLPSGIHHVVWIMKGNQSYDEMLGDVLEASNGPVMGDPRWARLGMFGFADGHGQRLNLREVPVTPNHHALIRQGTFSDNFYAAPKVDLEAFFRHLARYGVSFEPDPTDAAEKISDVARASRFIAWIESRYLQSGKDLPQFLVLRLPNDRIFDPRPEDGYPYDVSFVAGNDYALGRVVEFLSQTRWWNQMAVFITEEGAQGVDHINAQRSILIGAGPWFRKNYVSHLNANFSGLQKTILRLLRVPALNLFDASATDLSGWFLERPEPTRYQARDVDPRLFPASSARHVGEPREPLP